MRVRKRKYPSGRIRWQLDLAYVGGKRVQKLFDSRELADAALAEAKAKRRQGGTSALAISDADRIVFARARDRLAEVGATIDEAVSFFLSNRKAAKIEPVLLMQLLKRCADEKKRLGKRHRYLQQLRCSCLSFIRGRELMSAHEVKREHVEEWLRSNVWAPNTQRVYLGDLRTLFAFALSKGCATENPCAGVGENRIEIATVVAAPIQTLTFRESESILTRAAKLADPGEEDFRPLLTYVALGLFCGIRPAELERLDCGAVSLEERHVIIEANQSKTRRRRVVDISENALPWLRLATFEEPKRRKKKAIAPATPERAKPVKIVPPNFRRRWARLRAEVGWRPELQALKKTDPPPDPSLPEWPHDVMRHTFASMHYAAHQNESLLKAQMGHSAAEEVLFRHYRALKTRAEAAAFWALVPPQA